MPLDTFFGFGEILSYMIGGWRYLLSRNYRAKKHREWWEQDWVGAPMEIFLGLFGIVVSVALLGWAAWTVWQLVPMT